MMTYLLLKEKVDFICTKLELVLELVDPGGKNCPFRFLVHTVRSGKILLQIEKKITGLGYSPQISKPSTVSAKLSNESKQFTCPFDFEFNEAR